MREPLIELLNATLDRGGTRIVTDFTWALRAGEAWAVVGPVGGGKSTLLETLAGRHRLTAGSVRWPAGVAAVRLVPFREASRQFSYAGRYLQQRFNWIDPEDDVTLAAFVGDAAALERVGLRAMGGRSLAVLSNGQMRRARLAQALAARPAALLLDDPLNGLDAEGRDELTAAFRELVNDGVALVVAGAAWPGMAGEVRVGGDAPAFDVRPSHAATSAADGPPILVLNDVTVAYASRPILDRVSWTVRGGERWAVLGPNGAGKTTLLSLIVGDHPQRFSNDVTLFGHRPGSGQTVWDVKRRVGHFSPELHLHFPAGLTVGEAVASGWHDTVSFRRVSDEQQAAGEALLQTFGMSTWRDRAFSTLSVGQQRLALLARALVKRPPLVILDEPFGGLGDDVAAAMRDWLDGWMDAGQTLLFTSHRPADIPRSVTRVLRLDGGRVVG